MPFDMFLPLVIPPWSVVDAMRPPTEFVYSWMRCSRSAAAAVVVFVVARGGMLGTVGLRYSDNCGSYSGPDWCAYTGRSRNSGRRTHCFPTSPLVKPRGGCSSGAKHTNKPDSSHLASA